MPSFPPADRRSRGRLAVLAALLAGSSLYFFTGGGWNQSCHFDLVRAIVEQRTFRIDAYRENTGDESFHGGHYYSSKAPGAAFLAVPFVASTRLVAGAFGFDVTGDRVLLWEGRIATAVVSLIPLIAAAFALYALAIRFGSSPAAAFFGALVFGLATPHWVYSTIFWGHVLATGCLVVAFAIVVDLPREGTARRDLRLGALAGLLSGWAILTEFQAVGAVAALMILAGWLVRTHGRARVVRVSAAIVLGGLGPALLLGFYNASAFGSPFRLSYGAVVNFAAGHREGVLGVAAPRLDVMADLLLGSRRGLLPLAPALLAAPVGLIRLLRSSPHRAAGIAVLSVFLYYWVFNASYYCWWGGWCYGPRILAPAIAFLCLGLAPAWDLVKPELRSLLVMLGAGGVFVTLVAISTNPMPSENLASPFTEALWPSFLRGELSQNGGASFSPRPMRAFNFGEWVGLKGRASLIPLALFWAGMVGLWRWNEKRSTVEASDGAA